MWVVVAPWLDGLPVVEVCLAASVFAIVMPPLLTKPLIARLTRGGPPPLAVPLECLDARPLPIATGRWPQVTCSKR